MPLFRRRTPDTDALAFSVGVDGHRVVVGSTGGCVMLGELDGYLEAVGHYGRVLESGRDSIALQNAKMDYVEMTDAAVQVMTLALEELSEQGLLDGDDVPPAPRFDTVDGNMPTYEYIQSTYARAERRVAWMRTVDQLFRERGIAIVKPAPEA